MKTALFLIVIALAGCDKKESATTTATATATATAMATVTATATATASAAATDDWPAYLPDYPGAKVVRKSKDSESLETTDAPGKVIAFYKEKLTGAGFPPGASGTLGKSNPNAAAVLTMSKGATMVTISATPIQGTTKISVSLI